MSADIATDGREFSVAIADEAGTAPQRIVLTLGAGLTYRAVVGTPSLHARLLASFAQSGLAAAVPSDGGFVGNLRVWENLVLPAAYHGRPQLAQLDAAGLPGGAARGRHYALGHRAHRLFRDLRGRWRAGVERAVSECVFSHPVRPLLRGHRPRRHRPARR